MEFKRLLLTDFRNYRTAELEIAPGGLTVIDGDNGSGKTSLLEAIGYLASLLSFRGAPKEALVRRGAPAATVRAEASRDGRPVLLEAEIRLVGHDRVQVNRQPLRRVRDLLGTIQVTVFSPDDLSLVKGGPGERRRYLDDALTALHPRNDALCSEVDRVLRQRGALLKQAGGKLSTEIANTLDVWDAKLASAGEALADVRADLVIRLEPEIAKAYDQVAGTASVTSVRYVRSWEGSLAGALAAARQQDLRRGANTLGPQRDELEMNLKDLPARTHASQGEQRSLALALRLASHATLAASGGAPPVLLLDDVFSELDEDRARALITHLPPGQALLTTTGTLPPGVSPALRVRVHEGRIL
ncbi:MAG TPA: DNA replication/repair protein RecF [Acidimicrobiales bacterium]|nr:DNA replication/repair protein RecF [Acidimicrobiales bacterium]